MEHAKTIENLMSKPLHSETKNFHASMWAALGYGSLSAGTFFALIWIGLLDFSALRRYAMGHPVSIVAVFLFSIAITVLIQKFLTVIRQDRALLACDHVLLDLLQSIPSTGALDAVRWLDSMWRAQSQKITQSFFAVRFRKLLRLQIQRENCDQFDNDLQDLADADANAQHDSYSIVRIICWAMPMLGFLGTVIGISQTLGSMDMKSLASGADDAMKALTGGLYIAFDTTAVGLVLTIATMFVQFAVSGVEMRLLESIDSLMADRAFSFLKKENVDRTSDADLMEALANRMVDGTVRAINQLAEDQQRSWQIAMETTLDRTNQIAGQAGLQLIDALKSALDQSLSNLTHGIQEVQSESITKLESRYQQWQTTFSDQSRQMLQCQTELTKQSDLLTSLVENCERFEALDQSVQQTLSRMTDVDRFHEAAVCLAEAIAVIGIQLERSGQIGKIVRNRNVFDEIDRDQREAA